jgi:hypothetical protein
MEEAGKAGCVSEPGKLSPPRGGITGSEQGRLGIYAPDKAGLDLRQIASQFDGGL